MKKSSKTKKKLLVFLLALAMMPYGVFAEDTVGNDGAQNNDPPADSFEVTVNEEESDGDVVAAPGGEVKAPAEAAEEQDEDQDPKEEGDGDSPGTLEITWDFHWQNGTEGSSANYEYTDSSKNTLQFHPTDWAYQTADLEVWLHVAGEKDDYIPAGSIHIEIPLSAFSGWNGERADSLVTQLPQYPESNDASSFNYRIVGDKILLENHSALYGGKDFTAELGYKVFPLDVDGGYPDNEAAYAAGYTDATYGVGVISGGSDIDKYCWSHRLWKDYYHKDLTCGITMDEIGDQEIIFNPGSKTISVEMMTRAGGQVYSRAMPDTKSGVYTSWQRTWGTKPEDADNYFYVVWNVNYGRLASFADTQPWEVVMQYVADTTAYTIGDQSFKGQYVGTIRTTNTAQSQPYYGRDQYSYYDCINGNYSGIGTSSGNDTYQRTFRYATSKYSTIEGGFTKSGYEMGNGTGRGNGSSIKMHGISPYSCGTHFAVLVKYPLQETVAACREINPETGMPYIDLANEGLTIFSQHTFHETWEKGYEIDRLTKARAKLYLRDSSAGGVFYKARNGRGGTVVKGGQTMLADGKSVDLKRLKFDGYICYPYWMEYSGTSKINEYGQIVGQHLIIDEEQLMLSSGSGVRYPRGWQPEGTNPNAYPTGDGDGNRFLDEADYTIPRFNVVKFDEYNGTVTEGAWTEDTVPANDYNSYEPILVYTRTRGETDYKPYAIIIKASGGDSGNAYTRVYLWDGSYDEGGTPHRGDRITASSSGHYALPANTVGLRYTHDSLYYKTTVRLTAHVIIHPTTNVMEQINHDLAVPCNTIVKNIASYKVWDYDANGNYSSGAKANPRLSGTNVGKDTAEDVIFELSRVTNSLSVTKNSSTPGDDTAVQIAANLQNKQIAYVNLHAENAAAISKEVAAGSDLEEKYRIINGTFYELLPKGTSVDQDSFFGVYNQQWASHQYDRGSAYTELYPHRFKGRYNYDGYRYFLKRGEFEISTEYIEELDQTLLKIDYSFAKPNLDEYPGDTWTCYMDFYFIMENSKANIRARGTSTPNYVGFENNMEGGVSRPASGSRITTLPESIRVAFQNIADSNPNSGFGKTNVIWNTLTVLESGFSKTAAVAETINGIPQNMHYASDAGVVSLGGQYVYNLQYTTESGTKSDQLVFYDILETGTDVDHSDWKGKFESVDVSLIKAIVSDGTTDAYCNPKVRYSTTLTQRVAMNLDCWDVDNDEYWSDELPEDPSTVTAIAVDCRKTNKKDADGEYTDFHLGKKMSISLFIHMTGPLEMNDGKTVNGAVVSARNYEQTPGDMGKDPRQLMSRAMLALRDLNVSLIKESDPKTGTEKQPTIVDSDGTGTIVYRLTVTNTNPYDINNVVVTDPLPEYLTVTDVKVKLNGSQTETDASDTQGFTYELGENKRDCKFTIAKQFPTTAEKNQDTEILIYTTVDALGEVALRDYINTATLESANGKPINEDTDTMYHRAETVKIPVKKVWKDNNNKGGSRPEAITVNLIGKAVKEEGGEPEVVFTKSAELNAEGGWKYDFTELPKYYVDTEDASFEVPNEWAKITYTVEEDPVEGYMTAITYGDDTGHGFPVTITNSLPGALKITKDLTNHENVQFGSRIDETTFIFKVTVTLNDKVYYDDIVTMVFNEAESQTVEISDLPAGATAVVEEIYAGGNYVAEEDSIEVAIVPSETAEEQDNLAEFVNSHNGGFKGGGSVENTYEKDGEGWTVKPSYSRGN